MLIIESTRTMERWSAHVERADAIFNCASLVEDHTAARALPRVWTGRGLGIADQDVPGLVAALGEIMKTPRYWQSRQPEITQPSTGPVWSSPTTDADDGFVYLSGPCGRTDITIGYTPVSTFTIALPFIRDLRIRLSAYLQR